jgi:hypothetical protein
MGSSLPASEMLHNAYTARGWARHCRHPKCFTIASQFLPPRFATAMEELAQKPDAKAPTALPLYD